MSKTKTFPIHVPGGSITRVGLYRAEHVDVVLSRKADTLSFVHGSIMSTSTPNYRKLIARGVIVASDHSLFVPTTTKYEYPSFDVVYQRFEVNFVYPQGRYYNDYTERFKSWYLNCYGGFASDPIVPVITSGSSLINGAFAEVNQQAALLVDMAEAHQTMGLLKSNATRVRDFARLCDNILSGFRHARKLAAGKPFVFRTRTYDLPNDSTSRFLRDDETGFVMLGSMKKKRRSTYRKLTKANYSPESLWLEYQFGIMPTMMTVESLTEQYVNWLIKRKRFTVTKQKADSGKNTEKGQFWAGGTLDPYLIHWSNESKTDNIGRCTIIAEQRNSTARLGLSVTDLPSSAWELIPYSFVIDWFANIGDTLTACFPNPSIDILMASYSSSRKTERFMKTTYEDHGQYTSFEGGGFERWHRRTIVSKVIETPSYSKHRVVRGIKPTWEITFNPNFSSLNHLISATALAFQQVRR